MTPDPPATSVRGIGIYSWNPATLDLTLDETAANILAGDPEAPGFEVWGARVHPDDRERVLTTFAQPTEAEDVYRIILDDGSFRHVLSRVTGFATDAQTDAPIVTGVLIDVTASRERDAMIGAMLDTISDGFVMLDRDYRVTYLNKQAAAILGASAVTLRGNVLWDTFPDASDDFRTAYSKAMDDKLPVKFEAFYPAPLNMWLEVRAQPSSDGILIYFQDVTERRNRDDERERLLESEQNARVAADEALAQAEVARRELAHRAAHDELTDLLNRGEFERITASRLARRDGTSHPLTVLFLDLDRFKLVNDSLGHDVGDALLIETASRIKRVVGPDGIAARLGGDEFVVLADGLSETAVMTLCEQLLSAVREPADLDGYTVNTTVSIGLASADDSLETSKLLRNADVALYRAKDAGRDRFAWFDAVAHSSLLERISLEADLRIALDEGSLSVHYQPMYWLTDGRLAGVEALARWEHPERGSISPATFIPLAEDAGLMQPLGHQVAKKAIAQAKEWRDIPEFTVWINFSGRQFSTARMADELLWHFVDSGLGPNRLGVEVTETVLADETVAVRALSKFRAAGVGVAIDDFGTGYSSLARLSTLPISVLKIDRSFIVDIETERGRATLDVIVHLARALGMRTVAEGIETPRQLELVREAGVTLASGFLLGRPAPAGDLVRQLPDWD